MNSSSDHRRPPSIDSRSALFLDLDGTLVEFAERPDAVEVAAYLPELLEELYMGLDGALAIVSGRPISEIDRLIGRPDISVAGEHGAQLRLDGGSVESLPTAEFDLDLGGARERFGGTPGVLIEVKSAGFAVHTRMAPDQEAAVREFLEESLADRTDLELLAGKCVSEVRSSGISKGHAIDIMMDRKPFRGRQPIFAGDDVTDEDGFRVVSLLGGTGVKVGAGETVATTRLDSVEMVHDWLRTGARALGQSAGGTGSRVS